MYDCHIHMCYGESDTPREFMQKTAAAGVTGGCIFSLFSKTHQEQEGEDQRWEKRLDSLLEFTSATPGFHPVFWIDPTEKDAKKQIAAAIDKGVHGFKIICNHFYPEEILPQLNQIAEAKRPVHFHCGILYSGKPAAKYNRPQEFEILMEVPDLRFSLAHAGWPWTNEFNALIGEFRCSCKLVDVYADITPGTPMVYRQEVLKKLYLSGFPKFKLRVLWGTDSQTNNYNTTAAENLIRVDRKILKDISSNANLFNVPGYPLNEYSDVWQKLEKDNMETFYSRID